MTWLELEITASEARNGNSDILDSSYSDAAIVALNKTIAKHEMENDLRTELSLNPSDSLDEYVDKYVDFLRISLMYKQLYYFYFERNKGEDSKEYYRMKEYLRKYEQSKAYFSKMVLNTSISRIGNILRG
jgi:hypothetical protein